MIPATSIAFQDDGTAWLAFDRPPVVELGGTSSIRWHELDRPCDTCGETGYVSDHSDGCDRACGGKCGGTGIKRCDCINGRHTFPVDVATGVCYWCDEDDPPNQSDVAREPDDCTPEHETRSLRVSVVPSMVLPIVAGDDRNGEHRIILFGGEAWITDKVQGPPHRLDPFPSDAKPGGWAVQVVVAS